jgi:protein-disulfide isomerase
MSPRMSVLFTSLMVACAGPAADSTATTTEGAAKPSPVAACPDTSLPPVLAKVGSKEFTTAMVDGAAAPQLAKAKMDSYEARSEALENLINDYLIAEEATKRGVTTDDLVKTEISSKVTDPTEDEISAFYEKNKARIREPLETAHDRIKDRMRQQKQNELMGAFVNGLRANVKPEITLEPPRFPVTVEGPHLGAGGEPVQMVIFSDFQCPYCKKGADIVHQVKDKYGDKVGISFRHFPLPMHADAPRASEAAVCAEKQGKFWEMHDTLFANQRQLGEDKLAEYATTAGVADMAAWTACMASTEPKERVAKDEADGQAVGMSGTPGFYINGMMLSGARPIDQFSKIIDAELAKKPN